MDSALRVIDEQEGLAAVLKGGTEAHAFIVGIVEAGDVGGEGEEESLGEWGADPSNSPKGEDTVVRGKSSPFRGIRGDLINLYPALAADIARGYAELTLHDEQFAVRHRCHGGYAVGVVLGLEL